MTLRVIRVRVRPAAALARPSLSGHNGHGHDIFDIYYWMDSWPHFTDLLRNDKPVHFQYDDSDNTAQISSVRAAVPGGSSRFADRCIKAHLLSRQNRKKNI
jgi:hypothetical protein